MPNAVNADELLDELQIAELMQNRGEWQERAPA